MKNLVKIYLLFIFLFSHCSKSRGFYHGYVYDKETKIPIENVFVTEKICKNTLSGYTNEQGFFKVKNNTGFIDALVFSKTGYKSDTAMTVWDLRGEYLVYRFLNRNPDTLFMERIE